MLHKLKILPEFFEPVILYYKTFELRKNDRDYQVGDELLLEEWDGEKYTGRTFHCYISYIYHGNGSYSLPDGYCILSFKRSKPLKSYDGDF